MAGQFRQIKRSLAEQWRFNRKKKHVKGGGLLLQEVMMGSLNSYFNMIKPICLDSLLLEVTAGSIYVFIFRGVFVNK